MENILEKINNSNLNIHECNLLKRALNKKMDRWYIDNLINNYNIDKDFDCFTNCNKIYYLNNCIMFDYTSHYHRNEVELFIQYDNDNNITNVIYQSDRYVRFDYSEIEKYPNGSFQDSELDVIYRNNPVRLEEIKNDINEIKELCKYFFMGG